MGTAPYRLALDLGANSLGWCCLELDPSGAPRGIRDIGVRIFPDGRDLKTAASLAAERRAARAMRRRRDRYLQRRRALVNALVRHGLLPASGSVAGTDPWPLREAALHRRLEPHALGRVIFHLNQRRGFASNRKTDRGNEDEKGKIDYAANRLKGEIARAGAPTLGAWLATRHAARKPVRARLRGEGAKAAYDFYPTRDLVLAEFDAIWAAQAAWNAALTAQAGAELRRILFHQRPLKSPPVGKCWLEPTEDRAPRALPSVQLLRIAQDLAHLRLTIPGFADRALTGKERGVIAARLNAGRDMSFEQMRKALGLSGESRFNLESTVREKLDGAATALRLATQGSRKHGPPPLADRWGKLDDATRDRVAEIIIDSDTDEDAVAALMDLGIPETAARACAGRSLQDGHASLSLKAIRKLLPLVEGGMTYDKAVQAAGYAHHSDDRDGVILDALPYYGEVLKERLGTGTNDPKDPYEKRIGRAPNPTVHVALNELRRVVNTIIARHGHPAEIVVEVLRELGNSAKQRSDVEKAQKENRDKNEAARKAIEELGEKVTGGKIKRYRLWLEQAFDPKDRCCPYTGTIISIEKLFGGGAVEEDHILPFAITLDDGNANRVLVTREANRRKARQAPHEAFGSDRDWPEILKRVALLPPAKRWRFQEGALEKWRGENQDFLARHLTDSAYLARLARLYLRCVCDPDRVWTVPGRLTSLVRGAQGLNSILGKGGARKDRTDHRHHAVDALAVGLTDRGLLQRVSTAARKAAEVDRRLLADLEEPWPGFAAAAKAAVHAITVSFKPDHGTGGKLHNETAYGAVPAASEKSPNVVVRKPIGSFAKGKPEDATDAIRDPVLGSKVANTLRIEDAKARAAALAALEHSGASVRRVRTWERLETRAIGSAPWKRVKLDANHRFEFWRLPGKDGKPGKVVTQVVSMFDAAADAEAKRLGRPVNTRRPHPAAKLLMKLHKDDLVAFGEGAEWRVLRVVKFSAKQFAFADHAASGNLKARDGDKSDPFRYVYASVAMMEREVARKIWVDPAGRVHDPGPQVW
jgi:CRISPR-associated endonuclease Csn1